MQISTSVPSRRRRRAALACEPCRRKKTRCNRNAPCEQCTRSRNEESCIYLDDDGRGPNRARLSPAAASNVGVGPGNCSTKAAGDTPICSQIPASGIAQPHINFPSPRSSASRDQLNGADILVESHITQRGQTESGPLGSQKGPDIAPDQPFPVPVAMTAIRGNFSKTRFFGQSHWTNCAYQFYEVVQRFESEETSEIRSVYDNCKRLAKAIKLQEVVKQPLRTDIHDLVPSREVADQLVEAYLRTFESVFRVLHIPSFLREYNDSWNNPKSSSHEFVVKLLLVMAIGMVFLPERSKLRKCGSCPDQWIYTAQTWLSSPFEKNRINIPGIQIHCLLLLARLANGVGGDLIWISAGSLLRTAMHVGLHVDPSRLDKMSIFDCIMRRRLWATVLEIVVQSSVDAGGLPLVSMEDIDCELPSNVDDEQLEGENLTEAPQPKPEGHYTRSSIQIALMKSLPVRLEIARYMNDFRSELSYDKTLHLASRLSSFCRANFELFQESESQTVHCSAFQVKFLDLLTYRFLLALHHPFAIRSKTDPTYYFSRKTSLEVSLSLLSHSFAHDSQLKDDDFTHVSLTGTGMFRDTPIQSACMICDELIYQIEEGKSSFIPKSVSFPRGDLRQIVEKCIRYLDLRIKNGETNIRGHVFFSCLVGQIDAMHAGTSVQEAISEALRGSLDNCYQILRTRADEIGLGSPSEGDMVATAGSMQEDIAGAEGVQDWWFMDEMADGSFLQDFI